MKVALASDVHLEFGPISFENTENADVLILSGDICVASNFGKISTNFFKECSERFPNVVYIMGNHEHYNGDFELTEKILREELEEFKNIHFLEKGTVEIGDYVFVGGTLWTDMNKNDPNTLFHVKRMMNDFVTIRNGSQFVLSPEFVYDEHSKTINYIRNAISDNTKKYVIVGHHAPSKQSIKPRYRSDNLINGAYSSDLSEFILDHPQIKLWTHGHTHDIFDYKIGETRVLCNPRGYMNYEKCADYFELLFTEI